MPELPEVHTTAIGLQKKIVGFTIADVWTDYNSTHHAGKDNIKNPSYFKKLKKEIVGTKVLSVTRRGKNVLINLSINQILLVHMKMTGHLMVGTYTQKKTKNIPEKWQGETWIPDEKTTSPLWDPFNRFIHFVITFKNGMHLVLSDVRKFAKVTLIPTDKLETSADLKNIGPEPFSPEFTFETFLKRISRRQNTAVKTTLMDPSVVAGIGNIYSDEILWRAGVHPLSLVKNIPQKNLKDIFNEIRPSLKDGIKFKGDSTSDYRNIDGRPGKFNGEHNAYQRTGEVCNRKNCKGIMKRIVVNGRSAHFCPVHQRLFNAPALETKPHQAPPKH